MSSTLGCIGMAVDDLEVLDVLVERLVPGATVVATAGDLQARRWVDESGASLTMTLRTSEAGGTLVDLVPSYVAPAPQDGAHPGSLSVGSLVGHGETLAADLVDADGETLTRIACDLAQSIVGEIGEPRPAHLTALGLDITVHADAAAFAASDESILGEPKPGEPTQRFATESLLAYGLFAPEERAQPTAFLSGTVRASSSLVNTETGQGFHTARLEGTGGIAGSVVVCLDAADHPAAPPVGAVLSGLCYLVLDVPDLW